MWGEGRLVAATRRRLFTRQVRAWVSGGVILAVLRLSADPDELAARR
jgi:uncharacterized phage-associated protein